MSGPKYAQLGDHGRKFQLLVLGVVFLSCMNLPCFFECGATYAVLEAPINT